MSVVQNFERGYRGATGKYVVFLGDDDFVHPSIEAVVKWADANDVDAVGSTLPATYYWPDFVHRRLGDYHAGTMSSRPFTGALSFYDAKQRMREAAHDLGAGPLGMPRAYAGMVSMRTLQRISDKYGSVFGGVSPDVFSSTLIAQESRRSAEFDFPLHRAGVVRQEHRRAKRQGQTRWSVAWQRPHRRLREFDMEPEHSGVLRGPDRVVLFLY